MIVGARMQTGSPAVSNERITVLHYIGYTDDHSGIVSVIRALADARRFECVLGVNPGFVQHRANPLRSVEFPAIEAESIRPGTLWRARQIAVSVRRWLNEAPGRVFHGHSRAGLLVALWLHLLGERRVVATVHSYGRQRWFFRWASRRLGSRLFWLTPAMKAYYEVGAANWEGCMPNSLPAHPAHPRPPAIRGAPLVVGGAGMLVRWKRWDLVIEAMAVLLPAQRQRIEFRHAGAEDGSADSKAYARELREQAERAGLAGQVTWLGWQPSSDRLLSEVDCVVVASRLEPFSMIALEALFDGVPVVAADEGGPRDFIAEGESGWFFKAGDARDLARVFARLIETDARQNVRIAPTTLKRFETTAVAEQWCRIYGSVVAGD